MFLLNFRPKLDLLLLPFTRPCEDQSVDIIYQTNQRGIYIGSSSSQLDFTPWMARIQTLLYLEQELCK